MMTEETLRAPFPYFGGKRKVADEVWRRLGSVQNYVEPFFGSGAVLLARPDAPGIETVNDADGLLANFWRALRADAAGVATHADWPVNENDLHARHAWLVNQKDSLQARLEGDPEFFDAKVAGWWGWGMSCWIGSGFCSGNGPWHVAMVDGFRKLIHLSGDRGVNSKQGVCRKRERLSGASGGGVALPCNEELLEYFGALAERLRRVRVCCGDWSRVTGPSVTHKNGLTGVFLDPPYPQTAGRASQLYRVDSEQVAHAVREWAIEEGKNPLMRIALCGYEGQHAMPADWGCYAWNAGAGYGCQARERSNNGARERVWFSPHCQKAAQQDLF